MILVSVWSHPLSSPKNAFTGGGEIGCKEACVLNKLISSVKKAISTSITNGQNIDFSNYSKLERFCYVTGLRILMSGNAYL